MSEEIIENAKIANQNAKSLDVRSCRRILCCHGDTVRIGNKSGIPNGMSTGTRYDI
jgi:hypothetical protein